MFDGVFDGEVALAVGTVFGVCVGAEVGTGLGFDDDGGTGVSPDAVYRTQSMSKYLLVPTVANPPKSVLSVPQ